MFEHVYYSYPKRKRQRGENVLIQSHLAKLLADGMATWRARFAHVKKDDAAGPKQSPFHSASSALPV